MIFQAAILYDDGRNVYHSNLINKGEGMKTFNIIRLFTVVVLGLSLSAAANCNRCPIKACPVKRECAPCAGQACRLKPDLVEITKTEECGDAGTYKQVSYLVYTPCQGKTKTHTFKQCPRFEGCYTLDANGNEVRIDCVGNENGVAYSKDVNVDVSANRLSRNAGRTVRNAPIASAIVE